MAPYQFKKELGVVDKSGEERPPNAREREKLHGFKPGHTKGFSESRRISFLGNSFDCIAVAYLLAQWAYHCKYLSGKPFVEELCERAGYPTELNKERPWTAKICGIPCQNHCDVCQGTGYCIEEHGHDGPHECPVFGILTKDQSQEQCCAIGVECSRTEVQSSPCFTARALPVSDPGIHEYGLGEERITVISPPEEEPNEDTIMHLIQDDELISELHSYTMPPDHYY